MAPSGPCLGKTNAALLPTAASRRSTRLFLAVQAKSRSAAPGMHSRMYMRHTIIVLLVGLVSLARADATGDAATALAHGQFRQAVDIADKALASDPNNAWLHYDKGAALADLGQLDPAISELKLAQQKFS